MKKIYLTILACASLSLSFAQTGLTEAVDFTVTDVHGTTHNLFDYLNDGKHVVVDFFFTTCGPCQESVPTINDGYTDFGCNTGDVFFISIDSGDDDPTVLQYEEDFGTLMPAASGNDGGGNEVVNAYGISAFPTVILIAPNQDIVVQDVWPVSGLESALLNAGLTQTSCDTVSTDTTSTLIAQFEIQKDKRERRIFDLLGKEWKCDFVDLPKGVYIINEEKVMKME